MASPVDKGKENRQTIVDLVRRNQPIRAKELYEKAMKNNRMSNATVYKHLKELVRENLLKRKPERHKEVYYELTDKGDLDVRWQEMINMFTNIEDYEKRRELLDRLMEE